MAKTQNLELEEVQEPIVLEEVDLSEDMEDEVIELPEQSMESAADVLLSALTEVEESDEKLEEVVIAVVEDPLEAPEEEIANEEKVEEIISNSEQQSTKSYRFYCNACTNNAFLSNEKRVFDSINCEQCGKELEYNESNYIEV